MSKSNTRQVMSMADLKSVINLPAIMSQSVPTLLKMPTESVKSLLPILEARAPEAREKLAKNNASATNTAIPHRLDFHDYIAAKEALKYIGFLEQLQYDYDNRCKAQLYDTNEHIRAIAETAKAKIKEVTVYTHNHDDMELQDFDYPTIVEEIIYHFPIEAARRIHTINKFHNFGIKMILHWVFILQKQTKALEPSRVEATGIELIADLMVPSYVILLHFAEFIICMVDAPSTIKHGYPLVDMLKHLTLYYDAMRRECGAIAQSVGEIMVRIPNIGKEEVLERMTNVFCAVNHANYTTGLIIDAISPMLLYYEIRVNTDTRKGSVADTQAAAMFNRRFHFHHPVPQTFNHHH